MKRLVVACVVVALCVAGCGKRGSEREREEALRNQLKTEFSAKAMGRDPELMTKMADKFEKEREPVVEFAIKKAKDRAAELYGSEAAKGVRLSDDPSEVHMFEDGKWEIVGRYVGKDKAGKPIDQKWLAEISFSLDSLQCLRIKFGD